jgi:hypothetical protein
MAHLKTLKITVYVHADNSDLYYMPDLINLPQLSNLHLSFRSIIQHIETRFAQRTPPAISPNMQNVHCSYDDCHYHSLPKWVYEIACSTLHLCENMFDYHVHKTCSLLFKIQSKKLILHHHKIPVKLQPRMYTDQMFASIFVQFDLGMVESLTMPNFGHFPHICNTQNIKDLRLTDFLHVNTNKYMLPYQERLLKWSALKNVHVPLCANLTVLREQLKDGNYHSVNFVFYDASK